ncbi:hypothetical protein RvY_15742 [Ramazzottius varieornatus]|uniref:peptidyl-tRNA hydrolase n=1 Tax=Ramazzottius varieornatus TaxID=947166 RepID=A0A1D1VW00_RAMVA|nr:hypothetical protein RvY_15742 [Ramazzottius varieornatus]
MAAGEEEDYMIQYIVIRGDLKWPTGALIAQGCHAATAVMHLFRDDAETRNYLTDLDRMHKCVLKAADEKVLHDLAEKLKLHSVEHKLWIEQPENIPTCLAVKPYKKKTVQQHFAHLKLYR